MLLKGHRINFPSLCQEINFKKIWQLCSWQIVVIQCTKTSFLKWGSWSMSGTTTWRKIILHHGSAASMNWCVCGHQGGLVPDGWWFLGNPIHLGTNTIAFAVASAVSCIYIAKSSKDITPWKIINGIFRQLPRQHVKFQQGHVYVAQLFEQLDSTWKNIALICIK